MAAVNLERADCLDFLGGGVVCCLHKRKELSENMFVRSCSESERGMKKLGGLLFLSRRIAYVSVCYVSV